MKILTGLGKKSLGLRQLVKEVNEYGSKLRLHIKKKNKKKVRHLVTKYGKNDQCGWMTLPDEWREYVGRPRIFDDEVKVKPEIVKDPVVVCKMDEIIILTEDERDFLRLGPKFCVLKDLDEEEFETDLEECIMKIRWDMMSEDQDKPAGSKDNLVCFHFLAFFVRSHT